MGTEKNPIALILQLRRADPVPLPPVNSFRKQNTNDVEPFRGIDHCRCEQATIILEEDSAVMILVM